MRSYIEINAGNLEHNLRLFKAHTGKRIMLVVKANAYGHGLKEILQVTRGADLVDDYAVDNLAEALAVKEIDGDKNILVIGWGDPDELRVMIAEGLEFVVPSAGYFNLASSIARELKKEARCHLKLETGTGRLGMLPGELLELVNSVGNEHMKIAGIYSHFANIEDTTDHSYARKQLQVFREVLEKFDSREVLKHFSCSASTLLFPETYFDIVRVGISAYGFWPSKQTYISYIEKNGKKIDLKPVLSWHTRVAQVKELHQGEYIGYGLSYRTFGDTRIAVIPVGYYDGYDRQLSNMANIIVNGIKAPVRGRVCMNMLMAEVTHIPGVKEGDPVVLVGGSGEDRVRIDDLAEIAGTINYEMVARINPLIPRKIV